MYRLHFDDFVVEVTHKEIKNLHLSVNPPNAVIKVSAPIKYSKDKVKFFISNKTIWIKNQQSKILAQQREHCKLYIGGESHYFLGKRYLLKLTNVCNNYAVKLQHNKIELLIHENCSVKRREELLYGWYRQQLKVIINKFINHWSTLLNVQPSGFAIRQMKTKWGSCNTATSHLLFNSELAKKPLDCIEYVVVHELIHIIERKHNKNFVLQLNKSLPNWRSLHQKINELIV